jgi:hypothetical protein
VTKAIQSLGSKLESPESKKGKTMTHQIKDQRQNIWTDAEIDSFVAGAPKAVANILVAAIEIGLRPVDLVPSCGVTASRGAARVPVHHWIGTNARPAAHRHPDHAAHRCNDRCSPKLNKSGRTRLLAAMKNEAAEQGRGNFGV